MEEDESQKKLVTHSSDLLALEENRGETNGQALDALLITKKAKKSVELKATTRLESTVLSKARAFLSQVTGGEADLKKPETIELLSDLQDEQDDDGAQEGLTVEMNLLLYQENHEEEDSSDSSETETSSSSSSSSDSSSEDSEDEQQLPCGQ